VAESKEGAFHAWYAFHASFAMLY